MEEELEHERLLYTVTRSDLKAAYEKYFTQFLDSQRLVFKKLTFFIYVVSKRIYFSTADVLLQL
jgi:hypothetical protein